MTQKSPHTWDMNLQYHRCPKCGFINENRDGWNYRLSKYEKELECSKCHEHFVEIKKTMPRFGPLIGDPQKAEFEWSE